MNASAPRTLSKKRRRHFVLALIAVFCLFCTGHAQVRATSFQDRQMGELYADSIQIVEGRVAGISSICNDVYCDVRYVIDVSSSRKGPAEARIEACGSIPLHIGHDYIIFVSIPTRDNIPCRKYIEYDAVFSRMGGKIFRYMSPGSFNYFREDGRTYLTYMRSEENFDSELDKATSTASPDPPPAVQNQ